MMKFVIKTASNACRLGAITESGLIGGEAMETPLCMLYTRGGSAPYLTRDMLDKVGHSPSVAHMPINLLVDDYDIIAEYKQGLKKFSAMQDFILYSSIADPAQKVAEGYNDKTGASVWGRGGRVKMNPDFFMKVQEAFQPDWYQALCDSDTNADSSRKRIRKSVERTLQYLDECLVIHNKSENLSKTAIFGVIEGGHGLPDRLFSAKETAKRDVSGFCFEGFHNFGPETETFPWADHEDLLQKTLNELPSNKPRLLPGVMTPDNVMLAIHLGFDILDSSYPYIVTERGGALVFDYDLPDPSAENTTGQSNPDIETSSCFEVNLKDKRYFDDLGPLLKGCECYTCREHSRAYINHLLNTQELLSGVLLTIHNFHHYFGFFEAIRKSLQSGRFELLRDLIMKQKR